MFDLKEGLQQKLGPSFTVERELTGGGMSRVFVAFDATLGRRVVVKVLPPELAASVSVERFKREIMLAATLQHPHIVGVLTAGEVDGMPYFTMPFVEGESLRARIEREGQISVGRAVSILKDVARALAYAHERGVVHRDIKPDNVLLAGNSATVTDFGIAKALLTAVATPAPESREPKVDSKKTGTTSKTGLTQLGTTLGTPAYMAPEQAAADPATDNRADIYSFGIMAYEMLVGQVPFKSKTPQALLAAQLTATPPPIPARRADVPAALAHLVMQCLEKERDKRPQSAREIAEMLENPDMVSGAFASAPIPAITAKRRNVFLIGGVAAALALAVGVGAYLARPSTPAASTQITQQAAAAAAAERARAIVVLPFVNIGRDSTDDYLADGLTNDLINALARVQGLRVTSRSAAASAREKFTTPEEIGKALNVGRVLEGTIQKEGNRLRVTARVTNTDDGFMVWSDMFERQLKDVFAVQDEISGAIAAALGAQVAPQLASEETEHGTTNDQAYDLYLRGQHFFEQRGAVPLRRALDLFQQATRKDPKYARAFAGIASVYNVMPLYVTTTSDTMFTPGIAAANKAIQLDSTLSEAYAARAGLLSGRGRWSDAERDLKRAIALDPKSAVAHQWYGEQLMMQNRPAESAAELLRASELDPVSPIIAGSYAMALALSNNDRQAIEEARRAIEIDSTLFLPRMVLGFVHLLAKRYPDAIAELEPALGLSKGLSQPQGLLGYAYAMAGRRQAAEDLARQLARRSDADAMASLSLVQLGLGDTSASLTTLEGAAKRRAQFFQAQPLGANLYDSIRRSARFQGVLKELGLR